MQKNGSSSTEANASELAMQKNGSLGGNSSKDYINRSELATQMNGSLGGNSSQKQKAKEEAEKKETDAKTKKEAEANAGKAAASTRPTEEAKPVEEDKAKADKGDGSTNATASEAAAPAVDGEVDFSALKGSKNVHLHNAVRRKIFELQTQNLPLKRFIAILKGLVEEGRLAPVDAATFLAHYKNALQAGARPTVRKKLFEMQMNRLPMKVFVGELNQLVEEGKLAPNAAATFLAQYKKTVPADATGPTETSSSATNSSTEWHL